MHTYIHIHTYINALMHALLGQAFNVCAEASGQGEVSRAGEYRMSICVRGIEKCTYIHTNMLTRVVVYT